MARVVLGIFLVVIIFFFPMICNKIRAGSYKFKLLPLFEGGINIFNPNKNPDSSSIIIIVEIYFSNKYVRLLTKIIIRKSLVTVSSCSTSYKN